MPVIVSIGSKGPFGAIKTKICQKLARILLYTTEFGHKNTSNIISPVSLDRQVSSEVFYLPVFSLILMMNALRGKRRHTPDSGISALHNLVTTDTPVSPVEMLNVKKTQWGR